MIKTVPVNSLDRHIAPLASRLSEIASKVIASGYYVLGPNVKAFEQEFASWCGVAECIGVANGTEALELGLRSLGVRAGKRVAVVANAAMYGTTAVLACGAEPVFVDIDPVTAIIDPIALDQLLSNHKIDVVIVTHLYGRLADMQAIMAIAAKHEVAVFEDCAQAHGAKDAKGRKAGTFGDAASFSFYPTKNLGALGDGGAVVTNNADIAKTLRKLRQYGWSSKYCNELEGGRNSRLDEMQAAFLRVMLPLLDEWNRRRRDIANRYSNEIRHVDIAVPPPSGDEFVAHLYTVRASDRVSLQKHLTELAIQSDVHYPVADYLQPLFGQRFAKLALPFTDEACEKVITLPCFPELTDDEVSRVIEACNQW
jgi:dTDP-4-amino-4,6-dideoxygalactose transaminase